jgi:DNA-directed RNA polymerase I subunit RPA43
LKGKKVTGPKESAFRYLYPIIDISIPPALIHDPHRAADELMDTLLMRYVPQMSGVLLSHHNITFLRQYAKIDSDGAYSIIPAGMTCLVWAPEVGMRLEGQIQLSTPSHVSLLVHGIFNASITSAHLPSTMETSHSSKDTVYQWHEFQDGENDVKMEVVQDSNGDILADDSGEKSTGYWVSKESGERLGGKDGKVVFTVVG